MCAFVEKIAQANEAEIEQLLKAVLQRYAELFPDWEVSTISLQKTSDRNEQIDRLIETLEKMRIS